MTSQSYCYDLHSHSTASDGIFSPADLMQRAVDNQVNVLALTDHDTIKGLLAAHQYIKQHNLPLHLVDGQFFLRSLRDQIGQNHHLVKLRSMSLMARQEVQANLNQFYYPGS